MRRNQPRKRGHSQTESQGPPHGDGSIEKDTLTPQKPTALARPVKHGRARTILADDVDEAPVARDEEQPVPELEDVHRYNTRNPQRRPGKHVGLNWEEEQCQQDADTVAKAEKRKKDDAQKDLKASKAKEKADGIKRIAELEAARELEDEADTEHLQASTARGYRLASKKAASTRTNVGQDTSSSEYHGEGADVLEAEDSHSEEEEAVPKPKTNAQHQGKKRINVRKLIDSARPAKAVQSSQHASADAHSTVPADVFNNSYRQKLLNKATTTPRARGTAPPPQSDLFVGRFRASSVDCDRESTIDNTSSRGPQSTPARTGQRTPGPAIHDLDVLRASDSTSTPTPSGTRAIALSAASCPRFEHRDSNGDINQWDFVGGLQEGEGESMRAMAVSRPRRRPLKTLTLTTVQPDPPSKPKGPKRRTADKMPASKSLSALNLPADLYAFYEGKLIPSCVDIFGSFKDPWTIKPVVLKNPKAPKPPSLLEIVTLLIDQFHADGDGHVFEESDLIFKTRQRLINWRNGFLGRACTVVREGEKSFVQRIKMVTGKNATPTDVKQWAEAALKPAGGEAWYQEPITADNDKARGMFMSVYMLRTFAPHLAVISQSYLEEAKPQFGALAMAAAAVEAAFKCYTGTGKYQAPEGDFDKVGGGGLTDKWVRGGVTNLYNKRNRWDEMMDAAWDMSSETRVGRTRSRNIKNMDPYERDVVPHSSSPPPPDTE